MLPGSIGVRSSERNASRTRALNESGRSLRTAIGSVGIGLPQRHELAVVILSRRGRAIHHLTVELARVDFLVLDRLERGRMAPGVDSPDARVRVDPVFPQRVCGEEVTGCRVGIGKRERTAGDLLD